MLKVTEKSNYIEQVVHEAHKENKYVYIFGGGHMGRTLYMGLKHKGQDIDGFLVDKQYYVPDTFINEKKIICLDELLLDMSNKLILISLSNFTKESRERLEKIPNTEMMEIDAYSYLTVDGDVSGILDYDFCEKHLKELSDLYDALCDEKSRRCMKAFINQKISGKMEYLSDCYDDNQYFDASIYNIGEIKGFVDCGAYDGDSFLGFRDVYKRETGKDYDGISWLWEPDAFNYQKLQLNCAKYQNCFLLHNGAWSENGKLFFSSEGTSSVQKEKGENAIEVSTIDNVVGENCVDFIKMDIEGSEYNALMGAEKTIKRNKPVLAICIYHKKEDFILIPKYIKSIVADYQFYIRAYSKHTVELVLYAVAYK